MAGHKGDHENADGGGHSRIVVVMAEIPAVPFCLGQVKQKPLDARVAKRKFSTGETANLER